MKNINQIIKKIILLIAVSAVINNAYADGIAGADKYIPLQEGEPAPVTLTAAGDGPNCCYQWSTSDGEILSDANEQTITIKPKFPKSTFRVTRACTSGTESDEVSVFHEDFSIVDVIPKRFCYPLGGGINPNDFTIITSPEGYESSVKVDYHNISTAINPIPIQEAKIKFYENYGIPSEKTVIVTLVNESFGVSSSSQTKEELKEIEENLKTALATLKSISDLIKKIPKPASAGCDPKFETNISVEGTDNFQCCESSISYPVKVTISASGNIGIECKFPIGSFWGIFTAYAQVGVLGGGSINGSLTLFKCKEDARIELMLSPEASVSGGIEIVALSDKVFSASASLIGHIEMNDLKITLFPFTYGSFQTCAGVDAKLEAKLISFVKAKKTITLYEGCWWSK